MESTNNWGEWSNHVLIELKRLNTQYESIEAKIEQHCIEQAGQMAELKTQMAQIMGDVSKLKGKNGNGNGNGNNGNTNGNANGKSDGSLLTQLGETKGQLQTWSNIWMWVFVAIIGFAASIVGQVIMEKLSPVTHKQQIEVVGPAQVREEKKEGLINILPQQTQPQK